MNFFPVQAPIFKVFLQNRIFLTVWSQTSNMPVALPKNDRFNSNFLFKKDACLLAKDTDCVSVTFIISKLYSNELILPVGALVCCSVMITCSCKNNSINKSTVFSFLFWYA